MNKWLGGEDGPQEKGTQVKRALKEGPVQGVCGGESGSVLPPQGFCLLPLRSPKCSERGKGITALGCWCPAWQELGALGSGPGGLFESPRHPQFVLERKWHDHL